MVKSFMHVCNLTVTFMPLVVLSYPFNNSMQCRIFVLLDSVCPCGMKSNCNITYTYTVYVYNYVCVLVDLHKINDLNTVD